MGFSGLYCEILELLSAWREHFEGHSQLVEDISSPEDSQAPMAVQGAACQGGGWQSSPGGSRVDGSPGETKPGLQLGHKQLLHCSGVEALSPA